MRSIIVHENGTFEIDGVEKKIEDLTQAFLEGLVDESLEGEVQYHIEGDRPISKFFKAIQEGTQKGSELWKLNEQVKVQGETSEQVEAESEASEQAES